MKRFIVFAGDFYYPGGGAADYVADFDTIDAAKAWRGWSSNWLHVLDTYTKEVHETHNGEWTAKPLEEWVHT